MRLPKLTAFFLLLELPQAFSFSNLAVNSDSNNKGFARPQIAEERRSLSLQAFGKSQSPETTSLGKFSVSSSRGSQAPKRRKPPKDDDASGGAWNSFKAAIYGTVDSVGSIGERLQSGEEDLGVQEGYAVREGMDSATKTPPGQRLMNEYRSRSAKPTESIESQESAFDSFKSTVYGTFDTIGSFATDKSGQQDDFQSLRPTVQASTVSSEIQEALQDVQSKNPVKRKIGELKIKKFEEQEKRRQRAQEREKAATKFKESVYKLGDSIAWSAETISSVPSKVSYAAEETGKAAKNFKKNVDEIPSKVDNAVQTVVSIPYRVKEKADQVQTSFKTSVESTQTSFKTSVENTRKTFQEIQAIPSKVEKSIQDTQERIKSTREAIDESTTKVKVLAGLEKPKPKPPKTPPPAPPTAKDIGLKVAGSVATGAAKATWWISKGVAGAAWNGVQAAYKNASSKDKAKSAPAAKATKSTTAKIVAPETTQKPAVQDRSTLSSGTTKEKAEPKNKDVNTEESVKSKGSSTSKPKSTEDKPEVKVKVSEKPEVTSPKPKADSNDEMKKVEETLKPSAGDVDDEVEEALRQAQSALNFADEETSKRPDITKPDEKQEKKEDDEKQ